MVTTRRTVSGDFLMSTELELQTSLLSNSAPLDVVLNRLFEILWQLTPTMPGPSGLFNPYGRIYVDCGHVELALCECASPCDLPTIVERQQAVIRMAVEQLAREGHRLLLANNNSNGLLTQDSATWGSHENTLTERHPSRFGDSILPFLVTRLHAGSGGIDLTTGTFVAGVRTLRMQVAKGGGTTERRAIHSTAREEHHTGNHPRRFRYHLILGDGHRSHFNLALQFATTALALKAIFWVRETRQQVAELSKSLVGDSWVTTMQRLNVLQRSGEPWSIDPVVTATQRVYLEGARRFAEMLADPPDWIPWALEQWSQLLDALDRRDLEWLSTRLDAFAKFRVFSAITGERGKTWADLKQDVELAHELALLDQSYHAFCRPDSLFQRLESAGLMQHRLQPYIAPGQEADPYVPGVGTRADARARAIRQCAPDRDHFVMDWSHMFDHRVALLHSLSDPFARNFTTILPGEP